MLSQDYPDRSTSWSTARLDRRHPRRVGPVTWRLQWISRQDHGQSDAINKGFRRAKGEILAWLNSDDTYMPGAVRSAVDHLTAHPDCAMVYGDGYLIDEEGQVTGRFPATEPFDLWKLVYVLDYILQQSAFFRREAVENGRLPGRAVALGMDWDLFIKLGKRFRVDYLPQAMANLREHRGAKTFSGGTRRMAELVEVMHRHGSRRYPPARLVYGFDTYFRLVFGALETLIPPRARAPFVRMERGLERRTRGLVERICRHAQGLYADGWVAPRAHFLFHRIPDCHRLIVRGSTQDRFPGRQTMRIHAVVNGVDLGPRDVLPAAEFEATWGLPPAPPNQNVVEVELRCRPGFRPSPVPLRGDRRRLGFQLKASAVE